MIPTYEKIETIVNSFLTDRTVSGTMGALVEFAPGAYRVVADSLTVIVFRKLDQWHVRFKAAEAVNADLITAARLALDVGAKTEVSKHTDLAGDLEH